MKKELKLTTLQNRVLKQLAKYHLREVNSYLALVIFTGLEELHSDQLEYAKLHNAFYGLTEHNKLDEHNEATHENQEDLIRKVEQEMLAMFGYKNDPVQHRSCPTIKCPVIKDIEDND